MPLFQNPEKEKAKQETLRAREEKRAAREQLQRTAEKSLAAEKLARSSQELARSPQELARSAYEAGNRFFQVALPISYPDGMAGGPLISSYQSRMVRLDSEQTNELEAIESEVWKLDHAGYVFHDFGSQQTRGLSGGLPYVTGVVVGVYLFRRIEAE